MPWTQPHPVNRDDGAHTYPSLLHMRLSSSLGPSENGKLTRDRAEEPADLVSVQNSLSKQAGRVLDLRQLSHPSSW